MLLVSEHYQIVTQQSAEDGDFAETGTNFLHDSFSFKELLYYIEREGFVELSSSFVPDDCRNIWIETSGEYNYFTGETTYRTLHLTSSDPRAVKYWRKALVASGLVKC